jgi:hypothetical protein
VTQKLMPSLQAPRGRVFVPVANEPSGVRSVAFHNDTLSPVKFVARILCPSKATAMGALSPLPVRVATTVPVEARTTVTESAAEFGTQIFVPSKIGKRGSAPTVTVWAIVPFEFSLSSFPAVPSVTQILIPSKRIQGLTTFTRTEDFRTCCAASDLRRDYSSILKTIATPVAVRCSTIGFTFAC